MFPIVPSHMLSSGRQRPGASTASSGTDRSGRSMWNVWSGAECKTKDVFKVQKKTQKTVPQSETTNTTGTGTTSTGLMINQGGFANVLIPKDTKSHDIVHIDACPISRRSSSPPMRFTVSSRGFLKCNMAETKVPEQIWLKQLRLAMDVHSNNTILETSASHDGCSVVYLRVLRNIDVGEELLLWFSEEILALMGIPFLTPANIRGKNSYTCITCEKSFESPNPLKIHISTNCEQQTQQLLWTRLGASMSLTHATPSDVNRSTNAPRPILYHPWLSTTPPHHLRHQLIQPHQPPPLNQHRSAFQPVRGKFKIESIESSPTRQSPPITPFSSSASPHHSHHHHHMHHMQHHGAGLHQHPQLQQHQQQSDMDASVTAAAHLETIVSNMGTSKQGHLCIYCGKLYSRKYGLKIHIRTHTGFKPLKCKYCFRPFGDPSNLNKHVRLHVQGNTIYKCPECDKILVRRRDLQRHVQSRHTASAGTAGTSGLDDGSSSKMSTCSSASDRSTPLGSDAETSDDDGGHKK